MVSVTVLNLYSGTVKTMQYHIQTTPIWDAFRSDCDCPMCALYSRIQSRLVKQYADEAVMEPSARIKVNARGFCPRHSAMLYDGGNKLGVALQFHTRSEHVIGKIADVKNAKAAKKLADKLDGELSSCVICDEAAEVMERYAYTVAEMFLNEKEFPGVLKETNGFCLPHFNLLLRYASHAGKAGEEYLRVLVARQRDGMKRLCNELERFTRRFDYRSSDKQSGTNNDALARAINKLEGGETVKE